MTKARTEGAEAALQNVPRAGRDPVAALVGHSYGLVDVAICFIYFFPPAGIVWGRCEALWCRVKVTGFAVRDAWLRTAITS